MFSTIISYALIQSCLVFIFLTIFFFTYVSNIEKKEFDSQLNDIVDDLFNQYHDSIKKIIPKNPDMKLAYKTLLYGIIDSSEESIEQQTQTAKQEVIDSNKIVIRNSIIMIGIYISLTLVALYLLYHWGSEINIKSNIKEGIFILFFIFMVEFLFLNVIARNYISGNANVVKKKIAASIIRYIDSRN